MRTLTVLYASCACSEKKYKELFGNVSKKPGQQVQKYHRLFAKGFVQNGCKVIMITALPVNWANSKKRRFSFEKELEQGIEYHYLSMYNIPVFKNVLVFLNSFIDISRRSSEDTYIICDVLNQSVSLGALCAARIKGMRCIGIVTDLPDMLTVKKTFMTRFNDWMLSKYTDYVFLTEAMNDRINPKGKPYVVLEGHVDTALSERTPEERYRKFIVLYSGELSKKYGLHYLVEGFLCANLKGAELHLYGDGDYVPKLRKICEKRKSIKYFGVRLNDYVVKEQQKATLLVNPRPTNEEYTKYSFPSKNMEYMLSGTPVLTTKLPSMPKEYYPYIYLIEEESSAGVAKSLKSIYSMSRDELMKKGKKARDFVSEYKNCKCQALKVVDGLMKEGK